MKRTGIPGYGRIEGRAEKAKIPHHVGFTQWGRGEETRPKYAQHGSCVKTQDYIKETGRKRENDKECTQRQLPGRQTQWIMQTDTSKHDRIKKNSGSKTAHNCGCKQEPTRLTPAQELGQTTFLRKKRDVDQTKQTIGKTGKVREL